MSWLDSVFGKKAQVAKPTYTLLPQEQLKAIGANVSAFPDISKLGDLYSQYLQGAIEKQLPGYSDLLASSVAPTQNLIDSATSLTKGELPPDVAAQVGRDAAYGALRGGFAGSPMGTALTARDLGLTSLDVMKTGANLLGSAGNSAQLWDRLATGTLMNPSSFFITPAQQAAQTAANNLLKQNYQQYKYNVQAAPTPWAKGVSDTLIGLIGAYLSKGGGSSGLTQPYPNLQSGVVGQAPTSSGLFGTGLFAGKENVYGSTALPYDTGAVPYLDTTSSTGSPQDININLPTSSTYDYPGAGSNLWDTSGNWRVG